MSITIPRPHVPYGPGGVPEDQADADYLREAARKLEDFYRPFGKNLRSTIVQLLRDAADAIGAPPAAPTKAEVEAAARTWVENGPVEARWDDASERHRDRTLRRMRLSLSAASTVRSIEENR